jgi:serine/threonine-protein kinase
MGEVYLVQHPRLPRLDALKVLPDDISAQPGFRERFNREADLAAKLWHPHIVGVHDRGEYEGRLWIAMDFVDGWDAARLVTDRYPAGMPVREVAAVVTAVAGALDYAHKRGLLHRDVKPANIMLTHLDEEGEQRIVLADFGIARDIDDDSGITGTNMTVGTAAYAAPEQLMGEHLDGRADQYALAATAYHLLTGSTLFPHSNSAVVISRHLNAPPPALADTRPELGPLDPVLAVALAKNPDDRFPRCTDFERAFAERATTPGPASHAAPTAPGRAPFTPTAPERKRPGTPAAATAEQRRLASTRQRPRDDTASRGSEPNSRPADRSPPTTGPPAPQPRRRRQRRVARSALIGAAAVSLVGAGIIGYLVWPRPVSSQTQTGQPASAAGPSAKPLAPSGQTAQSVPTSGQTGQAAPPAGPAAVLPFTGLSSPRGVAVDTAGNVYLADSGNGRVLELVVGASSPTALPFAGLGGPSGVAVDGTGTVYVTNVGNNRVLKLTAGSSSTTELTFTGLNNPLTSPDGVAVDSAGTVYVTDGANRVLKLPAGSSNPTVPPFTGLSNPIGVAVDTAGNLYVSDTGNNRVLKLGAGSSTQSPLPFTGLNNPDGVAVDAAGNLYVTDRGNNRVLKLAAGSSAATRLPFTGLQQPEGVAVDGAANLYVVDAGNNRVVKLAAG